MDMKLRWTYLTCGVAIWLITACADEAALSPAPTDAIAAGEVIHVGGPDIEGLTATVEVQTRADAEQQDWLVTPLLNGLDIIYGNISGGEQKNKDVAILKLKASANGSALRYETENNLAIYEFKYRGSNEHTAGTEAIWYGNGAHFFEGVYVPQRIRYTTEITEVENTGHAPALTSDQHGDDSESEVTLGNYTLLSQYLGMPANTRISATVSRIKLPFRHRLARVLAYVLIDPSLGGAKIEGYMKTEAEKTEQKDDPTTSSIRFCNVQVLAGVKDQVDTNLGVSGYHKLTPQWTKMRKVIPHFVGERGSYDDKTGVDKDPDHFYVYYNNTTKDYIFPSDGDAWTTAKNAWDGGNHTTYTQTDYGKAPCYDLIVRPTYASAAYVMYDEASTADPGKNQIDFSITLENGLVYEKRFEFDLNANEQTVVYLRINREKVDYNSTGSELWIASAYDDGYYGVDNENGHTLSDAGSSWQRAYRTTTVSYGITDGHYYQHDNEGDGQYLGSETRWIEKLLEARVGGENHGDYFILDKDITIDARLIPANFEFTGHLDGQDHKITLSNTGEDAYFPSTDYDGFDAGGLALYLKDAGSVYSFSLFSMPELYVCGEEIAQAPGRNQTNGTRTAEGSGTIPGGTGAIKLAEQQPTLAALMETSRTQIYYQKVGDSYVEFDPRSWTFYAKTTSPAYLFGGLNGNYTTKQETEETAGHSINNVEWEANVHKEDRGWVPAKGYRAEILNLRTNKKLIKKKSNITGYITNSYESYGTTNQNKVEFMYGGIPQY